MQEQIDELVEGIAEVKAEHGERFTVKQLERAKRQLESKLKKLLDLSFDGLCYRDKLLAGHSV